MTDYFIKTGGNDGNSGLDDANAWASLDMIRTNVSSGDTVYLNRGDTWEDTATSSFASIYLTQKNVTVDAYGSGAKPIIDNTGQNDTGGSDIAPDFCCVEIRDSPDNSGNGGACTIRNLDLRAALDTVAIHIKTWESSPCIVEYNNISGRGHSTAGTLSHVRDPGGPHIFRYNFSDTDAAWRTDHFSQHIHGRIAGMYHAHDNIFRGMTGNDLRIVQQGVYGETIYFERNFHYHMLTTPESDTKRAVWIRSEANQSSGTNTFVIRNNVVDYRDVGGYSIARTFEFATLYGTTPNIYLLHNTVIGNGSGTFVQWYSIPGPTGYLRNNVCYDLAAFSNEHAMEVHAQNNVVYSTPTIFAGGTPDTDENNVTTDPNLNSVTFPNELASDADLTASSSNCVDQGYGTLGSENIPTDDHAGSSRSGAPDIGAFELQSGSSAFAFDAESSALARTSPVTVSHATGTELERKMLAFVFMRRRVGAAAAPGVSTITYNSASLTQVATADNGIVFGEAYYLDAPSTGVNALSVAVSNIDGPVSVHVLTFEGAATGAPSVNGSWSSSGGGRVTTIGPLSIVTTNDGAYVVEAVAQAVDDALSAASGQTEGDSQAGGIISSAVGRDLRASAGAALNEWTSANQHATGRLFFAVAVDPSS